jgi:predicted RNA binding protein YcfA (HicA-like mRNA interferase family)
MTALPAVTSAATLRALERGGFFVHHVKGSHHYLKHPERPALRVTVPFHRGDLPPGTLRSIIRQAGLTVEEFVALL